MSELMLMVGIPGSGKSTYIKELADKGYDVVNPDSIRVELTGNMADQSQNAKVWFTAHQRIIDKLKEGKNVILDATNVDRRGRREIVDRAKREVPGTTVKALVLDVSLETAKERVKKRVKDKGLDIPEEVMTRMYNKFKLNPPSTDEGIDEIEVIPETGKKVTEDLTSIANKLEDLGEYKEADVVDEMMKKIY